MSFAKDLTGMVFNDWTVLFRNGKYKTGCALWRCKCKCGFEKDLRTFHLTKSYSKQCRGCADKSVGIKSRIIFDTGLANNQFWGRNVLYVARKRKIPVLLTLDEANDIFFSQDRKCALTGVSLKFPSRRKDNNGTASLDRIDSSRPYEKGNVQWVHKDVNKMKMDFENTYFIEICKLVSNKFKS